LLEVKMAPSKMYCLKCKQYTITIKPRVTKTKNKRSVIIGHCDICKGKKFKFIKNSKSGKGLLNSVINKLPFELHFNKYQFCGPGTKLEKRLARGELGINKLDRACRDHDIHYNKFSSAKDRHPADIKLAQVAKEVIRDPNSKFKEKAVAQIVSAAMNAKVNLGM
jgi:Phospholipase A2-like domain